MNTSLYETIKYIQDGNMEKFMDIKNKFNPMIIKFSRKLNYDEAETDLIIALINTVNTIKLNNFNPENEGAIVKYIFNVMKHKYVDLFRKYVQKRYEEVEINLDILHDKSASNADETIFIETLLNRLSAIQKTVLIEKFIKDNSDIEIGNKLHISRQAVNRTKRRALDNLRDYLGVTHITA